MSNGLKAFSEVPWVGEGIKLLILLGLGRSFYRLQLYKHTISSKMIIERRIT